MNTLQSPSLSVPRDRYEIWGEIEAKCRAAYKRHDFVEGDRLRALWQRIGDQIRYTRIANRYPRR